MVDRLRDEYEGKVEFRLYNVDNEGLDLAEEFGAQYVPTFVFVNSDGSVSDQLVGELSEKALKSALDALK